MNIRQLDAHDLKHSLELPKKDELHIWTFMSDDAGNMHKNIHERSHILLRRILSLYTGIPCDALIFDTGKHGKPFLVLPDSEQNPPYSSVHFNLSHSGDYIVFIFSSDVPVGIDIEKISRKVHMDKIASRLFLPDDISYLDTLSDDAKIEYFFRCWTRMESFLKGIGTGLSASLTDEKIQKEVPFWELLPLGAPQGYLCCAAYRRLLA